MQQKDDDEVVTAWAENCKGPGWSNRVVWVVCRVPGRSAEFVMKSIQPEDQTEGMRALFDVSEAVSCGMTAEAIRVARENKLS